MFHKLWRHIKYNYLPYPFAYAIKWALRIVLWTCRVEINGLDNLIQTAQQKRCILALWHNRLAIMPETLTKNAPHLVYRAFVSKSHDGELLAILTHSYQKGRTLRVPYHTRHVALGQMISQLKQGSDVMIVTPDGPRGPRYQVKPGIVLAAREAAASVVPITWSANRFWQLNTWDRLMLPIPFSRIRVGIGEAINFEDSNSIDSQSESLTNALLALDHHNLT